MDIPATLAAQISQDRVNVSLSAIKQSAEADKQIANILDESLRAIPNSPVRGINVNVKA